MDFSIEMALDFLNVADKVGGNAEVNSTGQLVIRLPNGADDPTADVVAARITNEDFPYGYITAEDDSTLVFRA